MKINPADHAIKLTTTLNRLKDAGACQRRYKHLVKALGGTNFDRDEPINLLKILETNGTEDCLWALCATIENCDKVARLMAADFAEAVLPIYEKNYPSDQRPREAIEAARRFAIGKITGPAAYAAARAAADAADAANAAARAADAAADAADAADAANAANAAADAAYAAAYAADAAAYAADAVLENTQAEIIKSYLLP